jgi:hypothetical protein
VEELQLLHKKVEPVMVDHPEVLEPPTLVVVVEAARL